LSYLRRFQENFLLKNKNFETLGTIRPLPDPTGNRCWSTWPVFISDVGYRKTNKKKDPPQSRT